MSTKALPTETKHSSEQKEPLPPDLIERLIIALSQVASWLLAKLFKKWF